MSRATFPDGNGVRHALRGDLPERLGGHQAVAVGSMCGRFFVSKMTEINAGTPASCMTCLVREARWPE